MCNNKNTCPRVLYNKQPNNNIAFAKSNSSHTCSNSSHVTHIFFVKPYGKTVFCSYNQVVVSIGHLNFYQLIALNKIDRIDSTLSYVTVRRKNCFLNRSVFCSHYQVFIIGKFFNCNKGSYVFFFILL